jgi:exo-beta-1,3-glucanase (GH17 family)
VGEFAVLRAAGFTGLVTYGAQVERIPEMAEAAGFRAMLLGIWDPFDRGERAAALRAVAAHRGLILGLVIGNEGLTNGRYSVEALCRAMAEIRGSARKPVTTTEPLDGILSETAIGACSDFISVNAHPYFSGQKEPEAAVEWTTDAWRAVRNLYPGKLVLLKEVGPPTAGDDGLGEVAQKEYYIRLAATPALFCYFEAFDASRRFKDGPIEQSWGLWRADRTPKAIVGALPWRGNRQ